MVSFHDFHVREQSARSLYPKKPRKPFLRRIFPASTGLTMQNGFDFRPFVNWQVK